MEGLKNEQKTLELLKELDQKHIIESYGKSTNEAKQGLINQIEVLETSYPGGIREYCKRAKVFLTGSMNNENPYKLFKPSVPEGVQIDIATDEYYKFEDEGIKELEYTGFTLVAGGLGERLGYDGIKIGIPITLVTGDPYIKVYIEYILAFEQRIRQSKNNLPESFMVPLCIMTSDDTYSKTVKLLTDNKNFGMKEDQITIVKQEKVPALLNNQCHMALVPGQLLIDTKPHGHGDVHTVLHQSGVIEKWSKLGKKWVVFFQDTNGLVFKALPSAIGVSSLNSFAVNSITVPRIPGEAVGAICKLTNVESNESHTINVEYNFLDSLLKEKWNPLGDIKNEKGQSYFPGNLNILIFDLPKYLNTLNYTKGLMPEFVNPKYADAEKTTFKSPTRLECLMQDYPQLIPGEKIGFVMYERFFSFSPCKNNLSDAINKYKSGLPADSGFTIETDCFESNCEVLTKLGLLEIVDKDNFSSVEVTGIKVAFKHPKIVIKPSFAITLKDLCTRIKGKIRISPKATLILEGSEGVVENLEVLDGTVLFNSGKITKENRYEYVPLKENEGENYERMRGFKLVKI